MGFKRESIMKIIKILYKYKQDFVAHFECEHCGNIIEAAGHDDYNFHEYVLKNLVCPKCNKAGSPENKKVGLEVGEQFKSSRSGALPPTLINNIEVFI